MFRPHMVLQERLIEVLVGSSITFDRTFSELDKRCLYLCMPLLATRELINVGKTSAVFNFTLSCEANNPGLLDLYSINQYSKNEDRIIFAKLDFHMAFLDRQTGKSAAPFDNDYVAVLKKPTSSTQKIFVEPKPFEGCFVTTFKAGNSDLDHLQHVNNWSLYRFAWNGIEVAKTSGILGDDNLEDNYVKVRQMNGVNFKEAFPGDVFVAYVWKSQVKDDTICCELQRDGEAVFRCAMSFF